MPVCQTGFWLHSVDFDGTVSLRGKKLFVAEPALDSFTGNYVFL